MWMSLNDMHYTHPIFSLSYVYQWNETWISSTYDKIHNLIIWIKVHLNNAHLKYVNILN
jgi:hypothetical protein